MKIECTNPGKLIEKNKKKSLLGLIVRPFLASLAAVSLYFATSEPMLLDHIPSPVATPSKAPLLNQLNESLRNADGYISGLYKDIDTETSAMSEHYGFPLRVYYEQDKIWRLAGENVPISCNTEGVCIGTTKISQISYLPTEESFRFESSSKNSASSPVLNVNIKWANDEKSYLVTTINERFDDPENKAEIYLGNKYIGTYSKNNVNQGIVTIIDRNDRSLFQSLRYTDRHGTQEGQNYFWYKQDYYKSLKLINSLVQRGVVPDLDLSAPIWGQGTGFPDNIFYNADASYRDCQVEHNRNNSSYAYLSKVCLSEPDLYALLTSFDTLVPTVQAVHMLNKYHDPKISQSGIPTPLETAISLEQKFDRLGFGIPMCSPVGCENLASSIRTSYFGTLETILGYEYGRETSRYYADMVADLLLKTQIKDGIIKTSQDNIYRPINEGGFLISYNDNNGTLMFQQNYPLPYQLANSMLNMPPEYLGIIPSNIETTADVYAFLLKYRYDKYRVGNLNTLLKPYQ